MTERNYSYEVHGIDVSHHQGEIDWDLVLEQDISFIFLKATEGGDWVDPRFKEHWQKLATQDVHRGAYHFFLPKSDIDLQIENYYRTADLGRGDLPPVLDIETTQGLDPEVFSQRLQAMIEGLEERTGVVPILYMHLKMYYSHIAGRYDDYPIWIARYGPRSPSLSPQYSWTFWQYGERGRIPGIQGPVDLNVYRYARSSLDSLSLRHDPSVEHDVF